MKIITALFLLMLCSIPASAAVKLSSLAAPRPLSSSPMASRRTPCRIWVRVNGGVQKTGVVKVRLGNSLIFGASGSIGTPPKTMTINDSVVSWTTSLPALKYTADVPGEWDIHFDAPGCGPVQPLNVLAH